MKQGQGLRGRAEPPHPRIYQVPQGGSSARAKITRDANILLTREGTGNKPLK